MNHQLNQSDIDAIKSQRAYLLDVRTSEEVADQSITSATHWDVRQMMEGQFPSIPKEAPVYVYCRSGGRSSMAHQLLKSAGFTNIHDLGGMHTIPTELV